MPYRDRVDYDLAKYQEAQNRHYSFNDVLSELDDMLTTDGLVNPWSGTDAYSFIDSARTSNDKIEHYMEVFIDNNADVLFDEEGNTMRGFGGLMREVRSKVEELYDAAMVDEYTDEPYFESRVVKKNSKMLLEYHQWVREEYMGDGESFRPEGSGVEWKKVPYEAIKKGDIVGRMAGDERLVYTVLNIMEDEIHIKSQFGDRFILSRGLFDSDFYKITKISELGESKKKK